MWESGNADTDFVIYSVFYDQKYLPTSKNNCGKKKRIWRECENIERNGIKYSIES